MTELLPFQNDMLIFVEKYNQMHGTKILTFFIKNLRYPLNEEEMQITIEMMDHNPRHYLKRLECSVCDFSNNQNSLADNLYKLMIIYQMHLRDIYQGRKIYDCTENIKKLLLHS
jgi:hypothetical protein